MKKLLLVIALLHFPVWAQSEKKEVTLKGEIVDMHCYLTRHGGGRGAEHAGCANACLGRGVTPGFIAEGDKLYLLFHEKMNSVKDRIAGMAGQKVTITGYVVERDGVKAIELLKVEPAN